MTRGDRASGALQQLLVKQTQDVRQPINAVYYRNTAISSRIKSFIDYMVQALGPRGFE
jgi:DNA-binding transcriptional LysR family regulator